MSAVPSAAINCTKRASDRSGARFFSFPRCEEHKMLLIRSMKRKDWIPHKEARICSNHFIAGDPDGPGDLKNSGQPESPSSKKRRSGSTPNQFIKKFQASPALPDLVPPQPMTGFGETIVASNPFDDTVPASTVAHAPAMPMPGMAPHMPGPPLHTKPVPMSSGKVYPPDQPMVFNPQNPNAPPIYPCGICHKEVHDNDQAILCESGCNFWFHRICTGLTEAAFHLLTAEVYAEWVCDKCLATKNIPLVKFKP